METEPILVKSKISISTIFIIIAVFLCICVIIFIIINNKSKTPDCKNKCNNADDGVGGKCTKICDVGMKCVDKTCVCAPDCSDNTKCDDGCGGTCPCPNSSVCYDKKCCKPKTCTDDCTISDGCGGTCKCPTSYVCYDKKCCNKSCKNLDGEKCGIPDGCGGECPDVCNDTGRKCINKTCSKIKYNQKYNMKNTELNLYLTTIKETALIGLYDSTINSNVFIFQDKNNEFSTDYIKESDFFYIKHIKNNKYIGIPSIVLFLVDEQQYTRIEFKMIIIKELTISITTYEDKYLNIYPSQPYITADSNKPGLIWLLEEI